MIHNLICVWFANKTKIHSSCTRHKLMLYFDEFQYRFSFHFEKEKEGNSERKTSRIEVTQKLSTKKTINEKIQAIDHGMTASASKRAEGKRKMFAKKR